MEPLDGVVQNYAWGSETALARLRGVEPSGRPEAELWFGAHPSASSTLSERGRSLTAAIEKDPSRELGQTVVDRYGARLPYLVKLLAAAEPLSIQAHPTAEQALIGFEREEASGIPRDAPHRSFRDSSHKPELLVALMPFEALVGFRQSKMTIEFLSELKLVDLDPIIDRLANEDAVAAVAYILQLAPSEASSLVDAVAAGCRQLRGTWRDEAHLLVRLAEKYPADAGVLTASLLNLVVLQEGEAIFLGAGNLHAYVGGVGVEIMANSDNVLRGGLTAKHVDVPALLEVVASDVFTPQVLAPREPETTYDTPASEFELTRLVAPRRMQHVVAGPEILICTDGIVEIESPHRRIGLRAGSAIWVPSSTETLTIDGSGDVFIAGVGSPSP